MRTACLLLAALALSLPACGNHHTPSAELINSAASLPPGLPYDPLKWRVITSGIDPRNSTMFTLFGNDPAVDHARTGSQGAYPPGSILSLVTWRQQDDPHWYGAKIPQRVESVEFVSIDPAPGESPSYEIYDGAASKRMAAASGTRASQILSLKASVMP
jgi:hypothetical protein